MAPSSVTQNMRPIASQYGLLQKAGIVMRKGVDYLNNKILGIDPDSWMAPGQPIAPNPGKATPGRLWDYPNNWNLNYTPRATEGTSFADLQNLADSYDLLRLVIETRKDQVAKLPWKIQHRVKNKEKDDSRIDDLNQFFRYPDRNPEHPFHTWLRMLTEDLLVIDAATLFVHPSKLGNPWALKPLDGSTIHPLIDDQGARPTPPSPAYQQVIKGVPKWYYRSDQLLYRPNNPRTHKVYGYSPVEQIVMMINLGLRRELHQLQWYTDGNVPEGFFLMPPSVPADQVEEFERRFNSQMTGETAARRRIQFLPGDGDKGKGSLIFPKEVLLKDEMDEWLARVVCYAFSISPTAFVKQTNRATAQTIQQAALDEGLYPMMQWVKSLLDYVINFTFGMPDLEFTWVDTKKIDPLVQAQADKINVSIGKMSVDEIRARDGLDPLPGKGLPHYILLPTGVVFIDGPGRTDAGIFQPPSETPTPPDSGGGGGEPDDLKGAAAVAAGRVTPTSAKTASEDTKNTQDKEDKAALKKGVLPKVARRTVKRPSFAGHIQQAQLMKILKEQLQALGKKAARQVAKRYGKLKKDIGDGSDDVDDLLNAIDFSAWTVLTPAMAKRLKEVYAQSGTNAFHGLGVAATSDMFDQVSQNAVDYAQARSAELVGMKWVDGTLVENPDASFAITDSTRDMLRSVISQAVNNGSSTDQLEYAIEQSSAFDEGRASLIAETELSFAYAQGTRDAWDQSGVVTSRRSLLSNDHEEPDECDDNADAGWIKFDEAYPSGDMQPPYHPRCHCDEEAGVDNEHKEDGGETDDAEEAQ